jgi:hypothetical protein
VDIFDKAQDFLDRAQEKVADATTLAAWKANQAVRVRAAQTQKTEIESQIETVTMQLGHGVYQMWKNRGGRDDQKIEELCRTLDGLLSRYRDVNAELAEINRATPRHRRPRRPRHLLPPQRPRPSSASPRRHQPPRRRPRPSRHGPRRNQSPARAAARLCPST